VRAAVSVNAKQARKAASQALLLSPNHGFVKRAIERAMPGAGGFQVFRFLTFRIRERDLEQGILAEGLLCLVCHGRQPQSRFVTHQQLLFANRTLSENKSLLTFNTEGATRCQ
jgi:hypothetical protein